MSQMQTRPDYERSAVTEPEVTGWVGWVLFAGVMLFMLGMFQAIAGLTALFNDEYYVTTSRNLVIHMDYTAWGWTHLGIAAVLLFAGWGVVTGRLWARVVGITIACLSAISNLAFINAAPVWGVIVITIDVIVIYALAVHGRETRIED